MRKKFIATLAGLLSFTLMGVSGAIADQTISVDLNSDIGEISGLFEIPNLDILGVDSNSTLTINVTNNSDIGYNGIDIFLRNNEGTLINFRGLPIANVDDYRVGPGITSIDDNPVQFETSPFFVDETMKMRTGWELRSTSSIIIELELGDGSPLLSEIDSEDAAFISSVTSDPANATGWIIFYAQYGPLGAVIRNQMITLLGTGEPAGRAATTNWIPLVVTKDSPVNSSLTGNTFSCSPAAYSVGESKVEVQSFIYRLFVNGKLASTVVNDASRTIDSSIVGTSSSSLGGKLTSSGASWDMSGLTNYEARCEVTAVAANSLNISSSNFVQDAAFIAAANAKAQAWEDQRASATAANFTKEAREMRKRIAARSGN
jgi:hypothetical protein